MKFDELNELIPHVIGKKEKVVSMSPYPNVTLKMPGRHQKDTPVPGGDFVVCVTDPVYDRPEHQFTHIDLFRDTDSKYNDVPNATYHLLQNYLDIIKGGDPETVEKEFIDGIFFDLGVEPMTFLYAVQCLAVAEHRRYARYESKFGGRFLPFRFAAGIAEGLWTATDAAEKQKKGRPGVEWLERDFGVPTLTKELMS